MPTCMRCKAQTRAGHRCKRRTCKYLPGCHAHRDAPGYLADHDLRPGLFVARSHIRGAGMGLFTRRDIRKGTRIGLYGGTPAAGAGGYVMGCGRGAHAVTVDAADLDALTTSPLRFLNTWRPGSERRQPGPRANNVRISGGNLPVTVGGVAYCALVATRNIRAGQELLLAYGRGYRV